MRLFTLCTYLKTKESYDRWVTRDFGDLDNKYLKQNISGCRSEISGSFRRTLQHYATWLRNSPGKRYWHCAKWLRNSPGERYQQIRMCLIVWSGKLKRPPLPFGCEISGCKMLKHRISDVKCRRTEFWMWNVDARNSGCEMSAHGILPQVDWAMLHKGDRLRVQGVGTPLPDDTERTRLFGSTPSGFPKRTCGALPLSGLP